MLDDLEKKIINEISNGNLKSTSRFFLTLKSLGRSFLLAVFLFLSGLFLSVLYLIIRHGDWDLYRFFGYSPLSFFVVAFPYFWLVGGLFFLIWSLIRTRKTNQAYRYPLVYNGILGMLIILIISMIFVWSGVGIKTESFLSSNYFYRQANYLRSLWDNPDRGLLAGTLERLANDQLSLRDFSGKLWTLNLREEKIINQSLLNPGNRVKIIGFIEDDYFVVKEVRHWECGCPHCAMINSECSSCSSGFCSDSSCRVK
jgi:hypothetical protein